MADERAGLIRIAVTDRKGYVWNAEDVMKLRLDCKLMGSLTGGVAQYKNQNCVNGLPLELHADEVTLAVNKGWATLYRRTAGPSAGSTANGGTAAEASRKRKQMEDEYDDYYNDEPDATGGEGTGGDGGGATTTSAAAAAAGADGGCVVAQEHTAEAEAAEAAWRAALADGTTFTIPMAAPRPAGPPDDQQASCSVAWTYPSTPYERLRFAVFTDLHSQGFMMTGGAKFGCDMLAYPGDPTLYHAQFTVRMVLPGVALNPMLLKAAGRGSHAARKHLLLATFPQSCPPDGMVKPVYISIAPESGFGSKA